MPTVFWILSLLAIVAAESVFISGTGLYEQRSFEFATRKSIYINANIQDFVLTAMENNLALQMTTICTSPVPIFLQKCRRTFLYSTSETHSRALIFQDDWLPYLLNMTQLKCGRGTNDNPNITILAAAMEQSSCRILFRYIPKTTSHTEVKKAKTAFVINQAQVYQTSHRTQIDLDALVKSKQIDVITSIRKPFEIFLSKCDFMAPYHIRTGHNLTENEDQVELIIRMAQLLCPEDRSSSFDMRISSMERIYGTVSYEIAAVSDDSPFPLLILVVVGLLMLIATGIAASYHILRERERFADLAGRDANVQLEILRVPTGIAFF